MRQRIEESFGRVRPVHRYTWLWEPLSGDPTFVLRSMFGAKAVYLDGKLMLCFCDREEPWLGVLVCTEHAHHGALQSAFPELSPHPILPKWLYLAESADHFERIATRIVALVRRRDPRLGIIPKPKKRKSSARPRRAPRTSSP